MLLMGRARLQGREAPLGNEVRRLRMQAGLTQEELAEKIGISREAVGNIERGDTKQPSEEVLNALARHVNLTRQRALELIGMIPGVDPGDVVQVISRAAAEADPLVLQALWRSLPPEQRLAIRRLAAAALVEGDEQ